MAESELLELFEKANKAARKAFVDAAGVVDDAEESRCTEALKAISAVDISTSLLLSTQVGKRLRKLTKHASLKISASAQEILQDWKKIVSSEAGSNTKTSKTTLDSISNSVPPSLGPQSDSSIAMPSAVHVKSTKISKVKVEVVEVSKSEVKTTETLSSSVTTLRSEVDVKNEEFNSAPVAPVDSSSSIVELAPQIGTIPKAGGDSARDRVRELMVEALCKVWKEAGEDDLDKLKSIDVVQVAVAVENALFAKLGLSKGKEKAKYRSIMFNIKDEKNPDFRRRVLLGRIKPEAICTMSSDEMASDQRKKETESIKAKAMFECERGMQATASTDQFKCAKCGQRKTTYFQMQTRSADEPMTTFVSCLNCSARWKF
ncbi:hypothetical protein KC19_4G196700 [Ceratodon purpureus]|uniref:Transcription elongation factor n=1 Tax=Ceratodon purpureus TaxID=3225 RepID=A0A8T0IE38_CERPU|nr:hypothetical protein KC19_4G196700 [Ceratodon purpureus]